MEEPGPRRLAGMGEGVRVRCGAGVRKRAPGSITWRARGQREAGGTGRVGVPEEPWQQVSV